VHVLINLSLGSILAPDVADCSEYFIRVPPIIPVRGSFRYYPLEELIDTGIYIVQVW